MKACWISLVVELGTPRYIALAISVGRMSGLLLTIKSKNFYRLTSSLFFAFRGLAESDLADLPDLADKVPYINLVV